MTVNGKMNMRKYKLGSFASLIVIGLSAISMLAAKSAMAERECVNVFFDRGPEGYWMGKTYATFLQNLLGHFPEFQQIVSPIELYRKGDLDKCRASFYLGSYFENAIPEDFLADYKTTAKPVVWLGYSVWKLGSDLENLFGYKYDSLTKLDSEKKDEKGLPAFFRWIDYKGESFFKFEETSKDDPKKIVAPFEQVRLEETNHGKSQVLAWARHSVTNERIPYAIRSGNRFYVAEVPFSYIHESDRYLVFCDLLFDILNVAPKSKERLAMVRMEDVHPLVPLPDLFGLTQAMKEENIPINISLIPIFFDPLHLFDRPGKHEYVPLDRAPEFMQFLSEIPLKTRSTIWHGVTHQYGRERNPYDGISSVDFEFWNAKTNGPVKEDTSSWVLNRLHDGLDTILKAGLSAPSLWLVPHYQASALDYHIFARVFPWNVGRVIYFDFKVKGLPAPGSDLLLRTSNPGERQKHVDAFKDLRVDASSRWIGQFFPYEIYGDVYGQRLIPENLGNSQPYISEYVVRTRTVKEMVADAKRNLVIRDAWASFFYHPFLIEPYNSDGRGAYPGDPSELRYLVQEVKKLGYRFVNIQEFVDQNTKPIRPEPNYREN